MSGALLIAPPAGFAPVEPRLAATVILVRPGVEAPLEALLQMRHEKMTFMPGVFVFPGGRMDKGDTSPVLLARTRGIGALAPQIAGLYIAAIRETFEECGVLLARPPGRDELIDPARVAALGDARVALNSKTHSFEDFVLREDLELAADLIRPFSRWITPWWNAQRYDTYFFVVAAPAEQDAAHDGGEAVESLWLPLTRDRIGEVVAKKQLKPPTFASVDRLRTLGSLDAVFSADTALAFNPIDPWMERHGDDYFLVSQVYPDRTPDRLKISNLSHLGMSKELAMAIGAPPALCNAAD